MITRRHMASGDWSVELTEETPQSVRDALVEWGHVIFTEVAVDPVALGDTSMKAVSMYTGILTDFSFSTTQVIGGPHVHAHLGDAGNGDIYENRLTMTAVTSMPTVVTTLLPDSIVVGTIASPTGSYTGKHKYQQPAEAIKRALDVGFSAEYRVNDDCSIDAGLPSSLFVSTPEALLSRSSGGNDDSIKSSRADSFSTRRASLELATKVVLIGKENNKNRPGIGTATRTHTYKDFHGNDLVRKVVVNESDVTRNSVVARAASILAEWNREDEEITIELTDDFDTDGQFDVGDEIYVFDPNARLYDLDNAQVYRGEVIFPKQVRVRALSVPVTRPMGVYYRAADGTYTDISPYVRWELGTKSSVEVGVNALLYTDDQKNSREIRSARAAAEEDWGQMELEDGSASEPSLAFESNPDTGQYLDADGTWGFSYDGVVQMKLDNVRLDLDAQGLNYLTLPVKLTAGDPSPTEKEGDMYMNNSSNTIRIFADGAWKTVFSW